MEIRVNKIKLLGEGDTYTYEGKFCQGDVIEITSESNFISLQIDKNLPECVVYLPERRMSYYPPTGERLVSYPPGTFVGVPHVIKCAEATEEELRRYRNLALNPADRRGETNYYPHSDANFVTRDSFHFESRNAIDGLIQNEGHGDYPYQSWGGGDRDDLEYSLDFGREVLIDKLVLYLRADYAINDRGQLHDTYWKKGTVNFSDGHSFEIEPIKTAEPQVFSFPKRRVTGIKLSDLQRDKSFPTEGFAALTQIQVFGTDVIKDSKV